MHGRISRYSMTTGSGVVVNYSKKIFELRKEHWHDRKMLPAAGMYVECRLDDNGLITDAHSSAYQEFSKDSLIKEIDFWKTDTDEELRTKEADLLNKYAEEIFEQTDYLSMQTIKISSPIKECLRKYFASESSAIKFALGEVEDIPADKRLNYFIMRRFLTKAMDYLIYGDKNVTRDIFAVDLQKINNLEYSYKALVQSSNTKPANIYQDVFLEKQLHYRGALKAILGIREKVIQLKNKSRFCAQDIRRMRSQIELKKVDNKKYPEVVQRMETQKTIMLKADEEIRILSQCQARLETLTKGFKERYAEEFEEQFQEVHSYLLDKAKIALDIVCTSLDDKIWKAGMSSSTITNSFFRHDVNGPFCAMTFYWQYLKRLDKNRLADSEKQGYNYYQRYKKAHEKLFLIYTVNERVEVYLKTQIMSASKYYSVVVTKTDGEFFAAINRQSFELGYIDPFIKSSPQQIVYEAKSSKFNSSTRFVIMSQQQAEAIMNNRSYRRR